jgi:hypothetical protein
MNDRRRFFRVFVVLFAFRVANFLRMFGKPALTTIRPVDVVQLIGTGMCLGGAVVSLVFALTAPPST